MTTITFTSTERDDSAVRVTDGTESVWTTSVEIQAVADAYMRGYDANGGGDELVEFEIRAADTDELLARCAGFANGTAFYVEQFA
jgi:hypothetical protein